MEEKIVFSISQITEYIKDQIDMDLLLQNFWLRGEVSNFKAHYSGHFYMTLKDEKCVIRAVMFKSDAEKVKFMPHDGMKVIVRGRVSVYEAAGSYQLYVQDMKADGIGDLAAAYEQMKKKLSAEGLFDQQRKRPLPLYPEVVGVVTSPTGAAVQDICNILGRRFPYARVNLYPTAVQGEQAPMQIINAIAYFNKQSLADVLVVGRGGGSIEDLWAFNDEGVARAIAGSNIPVISAVGHETDFTIADFVADLRAPTPSAAAEMAVPDTVDLLDRLAAVQDKMEMMIQGQLDEGRNALGRMNTDRIFDRFLKDVSDKQLTLDDMIDTILNAVERTILAKKEQCGTVATRLGSLSPLATLARGYAIVQQNGNDIVRSTKQVSKQDEITIRLQDGKIGAKVI